MKVARALRKRPEGIVHVTGFVVGTSGGEVRLSDEILESFPPQSGFPSLEVRGLSEELVEGVESQAGIWWVSHKISVTGHLEGSVLMATAVDGRRIE